MKKFIISLLLVIPMALQSAQQIRYTQMPCRKGIYWNDAPIITPATAPAPEAPPAPSPLAGLSLQQLQELAKRQNNAPSTKPQLEATDQKK